MPLIFWFNCVSPIFIGPFLDVFMCYRSNLTVLSNLIYLPTFENINTTSFLWMNLFFLEIFSPILASITLYTQSPSICQTWGNSCVIKCIPCEFSLINCGSWIFSTVISGCSVRSLDVGVSWMFSSVNCASG
jgi:hypothetical protein